MSGRSFRSTVPARIDLDGRGPVVLHDDPIAHDLACVVADVGLMKRMLDVDPGGGEVSEVHHATRSKFPSKWPASCPGQSKLLRYAAKCIECLPVLLFRLRSTQALARAQIRRVRARMRDQRHDER